MLLFSFSLSVHYNCLRTTRPPTNRGLRHTTDKCSEKHKHTSIPTAQYGQLKAIPIYCQRLLELHNTRAQYSTHTLTRIHKHHRQKQQSQPSTQQFRGCNDNDDAEHRRRPGIAATVCCVLSGTFRCCVELRSFPSQFAHIPFYISGRRWKTLGRIDAATNQ